MVLYEEAYRRVLEAILSGKFGPGSLLKEEELSYWLKMSRTPVREALARLEREGFVEKRGRSFAVAVLSKQDVEQIYELRIPLEVTSAKLAALRSPASLLDKMREVMDAIIAENSKRFPDPVKMVDLSGSLHDLIAQGSSNRFLSDSLRNIKLKLKPARIQVFLSDSRRRAEVEEHRLVYEAVRSRSQIDAEYYMEMHEANVLKFLRENFLLTR
ncbi:MAG: GntR family transcriptional regulator [Thermoproteus sp.]|nr:GntR family transcriptional regulator [Thermoproteus sp.]